MRDLLGHKPILRLNVCGFPGKPFKAAGKRQMGLIVKVGLHNAKALSRQNKYYKF